MGSGSSSTKGPLSGPSGSGLAGVRGLRRKEQPQQVFQNASPVLDAADAKIVGKITARDIADDETTIGCGESINGDFDEIFAADAPKPTGSQALTPEDVLKKKLCISFAQSAKSGALSAALEQTKMESEEKRVNAIQAIAKAKFAKAFVSSAKDGGLASALLLSTKQK
jgi:hypothetical protein